MNINYLITSLIITLAIPLWGLMIHFLNKGIFALLSKCISQKAAMVIVNWLTFPGVIFHELSHALFALITGAYITDIKLFKPTDTSLGYVNFACRGTLLVRALQYTLTSTAPVICGSIATLLLFNIISSLPTWGLIIVAYLIFSIVIHSSMSFADVKVMFRGIWVLILAAYIICLYYGIDYHIFFS